MTTAETGTIIGTVTATQFAPGRVHHWRTEALVQDRRGLVGEFLSEVDSEPTSNPRRR